MSFLLRSALAAFCLCASATVLPAQQPGAPGARRSDAAQGRQARPRVPYTGMNVSGQPRFGANGAFRWATYPTVATVEAGSPAHRVGIRPGDVVLLVNGSDARDPETLVGVPGKVYVFRVRRGNQVREYTVTSTPVPAARPTG